MSEKLSENTDWLKIYINICDSEQSLFVSDSECGNSVDNNVPDFKG
jgi:hypothetical protein